MLLHGGALVPCTATCTNTLHCTVHQHPAQHPSPQARCPEAVWAAQGTRWAAQPRAWGTAVAKNTTKVFSFTDFCLTLEGYN